MKTFIWTALVVANALSARAAPLELVDGDIIPNRFIVQLKPGASAASVVAHQNAVRDLHARSTPRRDAPSALRGLTRTFSAGDYNAYAGEFDSSVMAEVAALPEVLLVEPDRHVYPAALVTQTDAPWHLGSLSSRAKNSTEFIYDDSAAEGGFAYVVDSGIRLSHEDFSGRASMGYNAVEGTEDGDQMGHGTHVASILAGKIYGVAKKATVIDVKVFGSGGVRLIGSLEPPHGQ
jgi:oryzin